MRSKLGTKAMALSLAFATAISTSGCSSIVGGAEKYPLAPTVTSAELRDYYAEALKYDSIISRNNEVHETNYVLRDVPDDKAEKVRELTGKAQDILGSSEYELTEENLKIVSEDTFNYIKAFLNDKKLTGGEITSIKGALGFYFVDVDYDLSARSVGEYKPYANLVGIHGAFYTDPYGVDKVDTAYLMTATDRINDWFVENKIFKEADFDVDSAEFSIRDTDEIKVAEEPDYGYDEEVTTEEGGEQAEGEMTPPSTGTFETVEDGQIVSSEDVTEEETDTTDTDEDTVDETEDTIAETEDTVGDEYGSEGADELDASDFEVNPISVDAESKGRRVQALSASIVNKVAGSSVRQTAYLPKLDMVYEIPANEGTIGGIGICSTGTDGLALFGFDKSNLGGKVTLRYVFKEAFDGSGEIIGYNVYPTFYEMTSGITVSNNQTTLPDYLQTELDQLLERSDRAIINGDIAALVSGDIYADMGAGMLRGYEAQSTNLLKHMSTIRRVIARDIDNNAYLLEVETTRQEGPKDVDAYGTYRDKTYIVVEQIDGEFYITDSMLAIRTVNKHPEINPDSSAKKRLAALNLTGAVTDSSKDAVTSLMNDFYLSCTYKSLRGAKEIGGVKLNKGIYDCFNSNPEMLSSEQLDYYVSSTADRLAKYGSNVKASTYGIVTEWIGGTENQVEFTTEELITFKGKDKGIYLEKYYLVSCMEDEWVIDEMKVLNDKGVDVEGTDLSTIKERIGAKNFLF